jgi:acyl transferase domain-containing protein
MLAVGTTRKEAESLIAPHVGRIALAGVNGPTAVTLAGDADAVDELADRLESQKVFCRRLVVACAFHSHHMDAIRDELLRSLKPLKPRATSIPFVSTVTGEVLAGESLGAEYWWQNVRAPVLFADAAGRLLEKHSRFVEVGPHPILSAGFKELAAQRGAKAVIVPSLKRNERATRAC